MLVQLPIPVKTHPLKASTGSTRAKISRFRRQLTCSNSNKCNNSNKYSSKLLLQPGSKEWTLRPMPTLATTMVRTRVELSAKDRRHSQSSRTISHRALRQKACTYSSILKAVVWPLTVESSLRPPSSTSKSWQRIRQRPSFNQSSNRVTSWC